MLRARGFPLTQAEEEQIRSASEIDLDEWLTAALTCSSVSELFDS